MKKFFIALLSLLMVAGFAYAAEEEAGTMFDFSGMINTDGVYLDNDSGLQGEKDLTGKSYDYMFYEMEFDADLKITPSDKTLVFLNMEIHDETFVTSPTDSGDKTGDDNIAFKRAYGKYSFDNGMSTTFGLMSGGAFGTAFGDTGDGYYRVRLDGAASFGNWGFILEKGQENGTDATEDWDAEKDDTDAYNLYLITKASDITLMFLAKYAQVGDATNRNVAPGGFEEEGADIDIMAGVVAAMGSSGAFGWEAEFMVLDYAFDGKDIDVGAPNDIEVPEDYTVWGLYGNAWMTMDAAKVGAYFAYGSADDDSGASFDMGADFYFGQGIGESQSVGGFNYNNFVNDGALTSNKGGFKGVTLLGVYADYAVNDALSLYGNFSYWMSNEEKAYNNDLTDADYGEKGDSPWKDATGYELTGVATYKLADNVAYSAGAAYGQMDLDDIDPDSYIRAFHKIQINF
jgi:hypothetical protein